jgi:hypothetical protein
MDRGSENITKFGSTKKFRGFNDSRGADSVRTADRKGPVGLQAPVLSGRSNLSYGQRKNSDVRDRQHSARKRFSKIGSKIMPETFVEDALPKKNEKQFSGLLQETGTTAEYIQHGYWMQGE